MPEALAALAEGPLTSAELRRRTPIDKRGVALLRLEGLADVSVKEFVEDVPVRTRRLTYGLTVKGQRMMELLDALSEKGGADLLQVTSRQLECMRPLRKGRKTFEEIPGAEYTVLNGLVRRGLIDKRIVEVKVTRRLQRRKPVYTLTERGERAQEACRLIESL